MMTAEKIERLYECAVLSCGEEVIVPDDVPYDEIPNYLEEEGWSRSGAEDDGEWMCGGCNERSLAGDEGD